MADPWADFRVPSGMGAAGSGPAADPWADFRAPAAAAPASPEFGSDPYINALAQKHGADPEVIRGLVNSQAGTEGVKGIPILGGLTDRAGAGISALAAPLTGAGVPGASIGERYTKNLALEKEIASDFEAAHPYVATAANLAGGLTSTAPLAATGLGAKLLGLGAKTLPGEIVAQGVSGAGINAADAAVRGNDPLAAAGVGGVLGAAAPIAGAIASPVINTVRGIMNPAGEAARRVGSAVQRDMTAGSAGLNGQEFAAAKTGISPADQAKLLQMQAAGATPAQISAFTANLDRGAVQPVNLMDVGGETTRALVRSAANTSPEGRALLDKSINDRFETQTERMTDWLRSTFNYPDVSAQQAALAAAGKEVNKAAYGRAYTDPAAQGMWHDGFEQLMQSPDVQQAARDAARTGANKAAAQGFTPPKNPFVWDKDGRFTLAADTEGNRALLNLPFWDAVKQNLDDKIGVAMRAGEKGHASDLLTLKNQLVSNLDEAVPAYAQARAGASHFFGASNALEAGQNFVTSKLDNGAARQALAKMSPTEKQLFQDGYVDRVVKGLQEQTSRRSLLNDPAMSSSPAAIERRQIALGPQRANQLEAMLHTERVMDLARPAVQGNSTTARQLAELGLAGGVGLASGGGNPLDPSAMMNAALVYGAARGRSAINERVSQQVAKLLTSQNPNSVKFGMQIAGRGPVLNTLRNASAALARVGAPPASAALTGQQRQN